VEPDAVVEDFNVFEDGEAGFGTSEPDSKK